jgi:phage gp37-like protein
MLADPLTTIENAIVERLRQGLGRMVHEVASYGGEFDEQLAEVVRRFPSVWVSFGGITDTKPTGTSKGKYLVTGRFAVMVGTRNLREADRRQGSSTEVGGNALVWAVRRLLARQDLGLEIEALEPGKVRPLFNTKLNNLAFAIAACEFETRWVEEALPLGKWPAPEGNADDPDVIFTQYSGALDTPDSQLLAVGMDYYLKPGDDQADARDVVTFES